MSALDHFNVLLRVLGRVLLVLAVGVPVLLLLMLAGVFGSGGPGGFLLLIAVGLSGFAWAFLPFIHAGRKSGIAFALCWVALALWHILDSPQGDAGTTLVCWVLASLFLAVQLKKRPPPYFPPSWHKANS